MDKQKHCAPLLQVKFHLSIIWERIGREKKGEIGYTFRVWAPMLRQFTLLGDFTNWVENQIPMERNEFGVWEVFTSLLQRRPNLQVPYPACKWSSDYED